MVKPHREHRNLAPPSFLVIKPVSAPPKHNGKPCWLTASPNSVSASLCREAKGLCQEVSPEHTFLQCRAPAQATTSDNCTPRSWSRVTLSHQGSSQRIFPEAQR